MKKFFVLIAAAMVTLSTFAQEETVYSGTKFWDNWYVGVDGGVGTGTTHQALLKHLNPTFGVRVGKAFTPVFGAGLQGNFNFGYKHGDIPSAFGEKWQHGENLGDASGVKYAQVGIFGLVNLSNAIKGFYGEPRKFEASAIFGFNWGHNYGSEANNAQIGTYKNTLVNNLGIQGAYNFGKMKEWQVYVEPSINWLIAGAEVDPNHSGAQTVKYNINNSFLQLLVGINYRFKNSNGAHYFMIANACDPLEFDELSNTVNELRAAQQDTIRSLAQQNNDLADELNACLGAPQVEVVEKEVTPGLPAVFFQVNKSIITPAQQMNVAIAAEILKNHKEYNLSIKGYASPEGPADNNNSLGVRRAQAVKDMLVNKYKINPNRIKAEGCGATDKLFEIYELNRVSMMFLENTEDE